MPTEAVLFRTWRPACIGAWIFFVLFLALIWYDRYASIHPLCPHSTLQYPIWYWHICYGVLGAFIIIWFVILSKILQITELVDKVPHLVAFNIVSMGTLATILALVLDWGGLCIDVLGVASPAAIWGEWCACGPLLIYVVVSLDNKDSLSKMDWFLMVTFFLCLITGFFIIIPSSEAVGIFWLVISCVTYLPTLYLPFYCKHSPSMQLETVEGEKIELSIAHIYSRKQRLAWVLTIILPLYTVNYLVALGGAITPAETVAIYQILSVLTKGFFASVTMDIHLDLMESARRALAEETFRNITESRRNFLKYIFHELRSPLNSLTIGIEILENCDGLNEGDLESLGLMKDASSFMSDTLNNVLSIQKIEEGKLELEMSPFSVKDAVRKVTAALRGAILKKQIRMVLNSSPLVPELLLGDRYRVEHVIGNLVSNAIKFSPDCSDIVIDVSVEKKVSDSSEEKVTVLLAVKDQGPGISIEDQGKLFKNFVQIRPGKLQKGGGSGLGLTIAKQIVELHGGRIGVTSVEGHGSQFYFAIPFQVEVDSFNALVATNSVPVKVGTETAVQSWLVSSVESIAEEKKDHSPGKIEVPSLKQRSGQLLTSKSQIFGRRVLLVDDSESSLKMLKMLLKKLNIVADTAENGRIAVDMIMGAAEPYQLVFMDNLMPEMDGVEATKSLREQGFKYLIIGVTGNVLEDDVYEYLAAGADMILSKPLKIRSLQLLLDFVSENGQIISRPDCQLEEHNDQIRWVPTKVIKSYNTSIDTPFV